MSILQPIETMYKGCRFRSRLEARRAVYFDALEVDWEYEKEGYKLPSGYYLPDFWLPEIRCWAEVKPTEFSAREERLLYELVEFTKTQAIELVDSPKAVTYEYLWYGQDPGGKFKVFNTDCIVDNYQGENRLFVSTGASTGSELWYTDDGIESAVKQARNYRFY